MLTIALLMKVSGRMINSMDKAFCIIKYRLIRILQRTIISLICSPLGLNMKATFIMIINMDMAELNLLIEVFMKDSS